MPGQQSSRTLKMFSSCVFFQPLDNGGEKKLNVQNVR